MTSILYEQFDTIVVPFPFTEKLKAKRRPALVISTPDYQKETQHLILAMITTAKNSHWSQDLIIHDLKKAGLPVVSVVRFKLFTLDERLILQKMGTLTQEDRLEVKNILQSLFF